MELRVELFGKIRRDARVRGLSIRSISRENRVSRRTARQALAAAEPPARKTIATNESFSGWTKTFTAVLALPDRVRTSRLDPAAVLGHG